MKHSDILKQLFPIELGGVFDADIAIEGKHLDEAMNAIVELSHEIFPDTATKSLDDWERLLAIASNSSSSTPQRRQIIIAKLNETGGLSRAYFINLAALLGFEIEIEESAGFFECGIDMCGWPLGWNPYVWIVHVITPGDFTRLEETFNRLKPAHTQVVFRRKILEMRVELTEPTNGAIDIPADAVILAKFSNELNPSTVNSSTFKVFAGTTPIECTYNTIDRTAYATSVVPLPEAKHITIILTTDIKGIADECLPNDYSWQFATKSNRIFKITKTDPVENGTVYPLFFIKIYLSDDIEPASLQDGMGVFDDTGGGNPREHKKDIKSNFDEYWVEITTEIIDPEIPSSIYVIATPKLKSMSGKPLDKQYVIRFSVDRFISPTGSFPPEQDPYYENAGESPECWMSFPANLDASQTLKHDDVHVYEENVLPIKHEPANLRIEGNKVYCKVTSKLKLDGSLYTFGVQALRDQYGRYMDTYWYINFYPGPSS